MEANHLQNFLNNPRMRSILKPELLVVLVLYYGHLTSGKGHSKNKSTITNKEQIMA